MTIDEPTISNKDLRSVCCEAKVIGHPESPSGDPTRCSKCSETCGTLCLIPYNDYLKMNDTQEISDDFDDKFGKIIGNEQLTYEIIDWWYDVLKRERKHFRNLFEKGEGKYI